jgi:hypothetical protein
MDVSKVPTAEVEGCAIRADALRSIHPQPKVCYHAREPRGQSNMRRREFITIRGGCVAARGTRAAAGDAGARISLFRRAVRHQTRWRLYPGR